MSDASGYSLLGRVHSPEDLRALPEDQLPALAVDLRRFLIETLGRIGGHFAANLGTVELTIALHYLLNTPTDRLVWDVGHQAYPHKVLTGRRARLETIRRKDGLAPFPAREESEYDTFGTGHSSTSISAAVGMAEAIRIRGARGEQRVACVIGDGGMTAGMAFEALNHLGTAGSDVLVIYNDNDMSISENVGALRDHCARVFSRHPDAARSSEAYRRARAPESDLAPDDGDLFESLGVQYLGPVDGHNLTQLLPALRNALTIKGPRLLHVATVKGKGFDPAECDPIAYHGVTSFDPVTGEMPKSKSSRPTFTKIFGQWLCEAAESNPNLVAITPAMREGSGLVEFAQRFPDRYFDVAIAEQHAVTLGAGLATEGLHPVVAIYSTFLQRGYDQLVHDVAIQNLPVLFAIDRGGLVGADGATHNGAFDLSFLRCIPNLVIMAPSDENECRRMLATGMAHPGPSAVRYPRGSGPGADIDEKLRPLPIGEARILRSALGRRRPRVAILAFGIMVEPALAAAELLDATVVDMRFVKPLDEDMILRMADEADLLVTVEDNVIAGGAGSAVNEVLMERHLAVPALNLGLPDAFVEHGGREEMLASLGLDAAGIQRAIQRRLRARDLDEASSAGQAG
ncbi:MAG: 1-deoxy-D-xylulose-5-phosphate synthase [Abyssibacter sp.]|uniref:1-deoxy-D-xylulose-5-phosphate synthase n=1 Tax=Abyssibacter sp. TaxID=2320200 RepID=UPI00321C3595